MIEYKFSRYTGKTLERNMDQEKMKKIEVLKSPSFLSRYRVIFVAIGGVFALHLGWWQLVETYVPPEDRPKRFKYLAELDSLIHRDKEEKT